MEYFAFQWHITEACDQRCKHCYIYALCSHVRFRQMAEKNMDAVLANIKEFGAGCLLLMFMCQRSSRALPMTILSKTLSTMRQR